MTVLPLVEPFPAHLQQRGGAPALTSAEYLHVIKETIRHHPRSLQKRIGPSEVGHPCTRRIGYKVLGLDECNPSDDTPWLPTIGTAVHAWLEDAFTQVNAGHDYARWLTELRVDVGTIGGVAITGCCDLYDRVTATVIDHKVVGPTQLKKYRAKGPGDQYRSQIHLYGRGLERRGLPVDTVSIAFLPRSGELTDSHVWSEPYDEQVALDALRRADGVALGAQALGPAVLDQLATADAFCHRCPFFTAGSTDLATGCPGDPHARGQFRHDPGASAFGPIERNPSMSAQTIDPFAGGTSTPSVSFKDAPIGTSYTGTVTEAPQLVQARDFDDGKPAFWDDGNPKMTVVTKLKVDGEERSLWAPKPSAMFAAIAAAQQEAGELVAVGGTLTVTYVGDRPNEKNPRLNPAKQYKVSYRPGNAFANSEQGPVDTRTGELTEPAPPAKPAGPTPEQVAALTAAGIDIKQVYPDYVG